MAAVAYRKWSFTRDSNCKALTGKVLVFWISGRLWEVVAHGGSTAYKTYYLEVSIWLVKKELLKGAVSRQSSSFCLILQITRPQPLWNLK